MRKPLLACVFLLMIVAALALAKNITTHPAIEPIKPEPVAATCFCKVRSNGLDAETLSFPGYTEIKDKKKCEAKCELFWDVAATAPGNPKILEWAKKPTGSCGVVKVTMEASIGTQLPHVVRSQPVDVGVACPNGGGTGDPKGNFVQVVGTGSSFIKIKFGAKDPPVEWKVLWSTLNHGPRCDVGNAHEDKFVNTDGLKTREYEISNLKTEKRYYFDVCAKSSGPLFKFIARGNAITTP